MRKAVTILAGLLGLCLAAGAQNNASLILKRTIALPFATGRFDHMAYDAENNRLFVAATGNHSVEVLNIKTSERAETIAGLGKPHGLALIPQEKKLFVSDGTLAALKVYSGSPLKEIASLPLSDDADDMVYDAQTGWLYVGHGGSSASVPGRVAVIDTRTNTLLENLPVSAHPEALELDEHARRIFVNVADSGEILVIDGATHSKIATWKLTRAKDNVPVAFAEQERALLVGCRSPARIVSLDTEAGSEVSDAPSAAGADDLFYDGQTHRAYLIAGSGTVDVYSIGSDKTLKSLDSISTSAGAKTGLFVPAIRELFVALPGAAGRAAEIRVYSTAK